MIICKKNKIELLGYFIAAFLIIIATGCTKEKDAPIVYETGTVTDMDNITYRTIKIGKQWWMAENLRTKTYRNGEALQQVQSSAGWMDTVASYCIYDNNNSAPGLLYNWFAVNQNKLIAPIGWHIPSDDEWKELEKHLGMPAVETDKSGWRGTHEGEYLKIEAPLGWTRYDNVWATNISQFSALAGSCRLYNGTFGDPGLYATGFWWTSSEKNSTKAWYRHLDYKKANVFRYYDSKNNGYSIRCIKD